MKELIRDVSLGDEMSFLRENLDKIEAFCDEVGARKKEISIARKHTSEQLIRLVYIVRSLLSENKGLKAKINQLEQQLTDESPF